MPETNLEVFKLTLTHTGLNKDGGPNLNPVLIPDLDVGYEYQLRKVPVYVPVGGSITLVYTSRSMFSVAQGAVKTFVAQGLITAVTLVENQSGVARPIMNSGNTINWLFDGPVDPSGGYLTDWEDVVSLANTMTGPVTIQILDNPDNTTVTIPTNFDADGNFIPWVFTNPTTLVGRCVNANTTGGSVGDYWADPERLNVTTDFGCTMKGVVGLKDMYFYSYSGDNTIIIDNTYDWSAFFTFDNCSFYRDYEDYYASLYITDGVSATITLKNNAQIHWYSVFLDTNAYATVTADGTNCWVGLLAFYGDGYSYVDFFMNPGSAFNENQDLDGWYFINPWVQISSDYINSGDWSGSAPNNTMDAINRMASLLKSLNSNNPIP